MTLEQSAQGKQAPLTGAVFLHRFKGIGRAGRDKTAAGRTGWGYVSLIKPDTIDEKALHF